MKTFPMIEILEQRIAPAAVLDARTLLFTDTDGDAVTVTFSKDVFLGTLAQRDATANLVFKFDVGTVANETAAEQQLQLIDFTKFSSSVLTGSVASGASMTITATAGVGGDGFVDVGAIKGTGISLGKITIDGDFLMFIEW